MRQLNKIVIPGDQCPSGFPKVHGNKCVRGCPAQFGYYEVDSECNPAESGKVIIVDKDWFGIGIVDSVDACDT